MNLGLFELRITDPVLDKPSYAGINLLGIRKNIRENRCYSFFSLKLSIAALFLATKIEGQNKKLEHVIKVAQQCFEQNATPLDVKSLAYSKKHNEIVILENILLQTIGFHLEIQHPHVFVEKVCHFVKASQELAQISYFLATTSLHVTTMCLRYKPSLVACVCFHVACKWSNWKIEPCSEGKEWYYYIDKTLTLQYLETLTQEFIAILEASPLRLKKSFIKQKNACESKSILDKSSNSGNACESKSILDESSNSGKHSSFSSSKIDFLRRGSSLGLSSVSFNLCTDINEKSVAKAEEVEKSTAPAQPSPCKKRKHKMELSHSISTLTDPEEGNKEELRHTSSVDAKESMHSLNNVSRNSSHISNDPLDVLARCDAEFKRKNVSVMNSSNSKLSVIDHSDVVIQR
ncbi:Cyclin-T2, partial [Stegodyphus mimosarum]